MALINGKFREYKLDNGLYVALQETPTSTIAANLKINFGAVHEREGEEGTAHFLEHAFVTGGTAKYDPVQTDKIRGTFGQFNASTYLDKTVVPADMLPEDIELYLDFASDLAFNPRLDESRINQERQRVLRETADHKSRPNYKDIRDARRALFGNHPVTYEILGKEEVIAKATPTDLRNFHSRGYNANNMELILVGNLPQNIEELIAKYFSDRPRGQNTKFQFPPVQRIDRKVELYRRAPELYNKDNPEASTAEVGIGFLAAPETSNDFAALQILSIVLGGDASSRLFKNISMEKGLAYGVRSYYDGSYNKGDFRVYGDVASVRQQEAIDAMFEEMRKLRDLPVQQDELNRIVRNGRYAMGKSLETNEGHVGAIERRNELGYTSEVAMRNWELMTPERLQEAAIQYLPRDRDEGIYTLLVRDPLRIE